MKESRLSSQVLELEKVTKRFGDITAVDDVSLSIPRGSIYGFLGQNGAGKTTTIRMIFDILKPTSGRISILGASSALDVRHRIGYLPEEKGLYKAMTAAATIAYFASLKGVPRKAAKQRARKLLERYGLGEFADTRIQALSKGMGQKVQVLCAVAHEPEFVVLDEPFSGLDPVNQQVLEHLRRSSYSVIVSPKPGEKGNIQGPCRQIPGECIVQRLKKGFCVSNTFDFGIVANLFTS